MSDLWLLTYEAIPNPGNPAAQKSGGAFVNCWIKAESQSDAANIAVREISAADWSIEALIEAKPVDPQTELYPPASMLLIQQAQAEGAVFCFNYWPA